MCLLFQVSYLLGEIPLKLCHPYLTMQVNVKATTTEKLGFEGRKEGISSHAVVIMSKQNS